MPSSVVGAAGPSTLFVNSAVRITPAVTNTVMLAARPFMVSFRAEQAFLTSLAALDCALQILSDWLRARD